MADSPIIGAENKRAQFEATALPFMRSIYNTALCLTRRPEDASDLVQETYLRAYRTFPNFTPGTNCKAWLFTIVYSVFVNKYRKEQREPESVSIEELEEKFHRSLAAAERLGFIDSGKTRVRVAVVRYPKGYVTQPESSFVLLPSCAASSFN